MRERTEKKPYATSDGLVRIVVLTFCSVKNLNMRVKEGEIVVKVPYSTTYGRVEAFLKKHDGWIRRQLDCEKVVSDDLSIRGESFSVRWEAGKKNVLFLPTEVVVSVPDGSKKSAMATLKAAYKKRAEEFFLQRVKDLFIVAAPVVKKATVPKLTVRYCTSYWGKCFFSRDEIRLNAYLYQAPDEVIDYVIYHEYAHFLVQNHGEKFYRTVEKMCPDYKKARAEQKKYRCRAIFTEE